MNAKYLKKIVQLHKQQIESSIIEHKERISSKIYEHKIQKKLIELQAKISKTNQKIEAINGRLKVEMNPSQIQILTQKIGKLQTKLSNLIQWKQELDDQDTRKNQSNDNYKDQINNSSLIECQIQQQNVLTAKNTQDKQQINMIKQVNKTRFKVEKQLQYLKQNLNIKPQKRLEVEKKLINYKIDLQKYLETSSDKQFIDGPIGQDLLEKILQINLYFENIQSFNVIEHQLKYQQPEKSHQVKLEDQKQDQKDISQLPQSDSEIKIEAKQSLITNNPKNQQKQQQADTSKQVFQTQTQKEEIQKNIQNNEKSLVDQDINLCQICFDRKKEFITIPCGHYIYCDICKDLIKKNCLLCRKDVQSILKVYS